MIGLILPIFLRLGLSQRLAKVAAWAALGIAALALLWLAKTLYDRSIVEDHEAKREAAASGAREIAADARATDTVTNTKSEQEMHDAINAAPSGGSLSPAAHALACERLRKRGRIPAACGSERGDGGQAGAR